MKILAVVILTILSLRQAIRAHIKQNSKEGDKLALILFPTVIFYLTVLGVI